MIQSKTKAKTERKGKEYAKKAWNKEETELYEEEERRRMNVLREGSKSESVTGSL
jgi:hypothetical protein